MSVAFFLNIRLCRGQIKTSILKSKKEKQQLVNRPFIHSLIHTPVYSKFVFYEDTLLAIFVFGFVTSSNRCRIELLIHLNFKEFG